MIYITSTSKRDDCSKENNFKVKLTITKKKVISEKSKNAVSEACCLLVSTWQTEPHQRRQLAQPKSNNCNFSLFKTDSGKQN